jgi:hypothetical protein
MDEAVTVEGRTLSRREQDRKGVAQPVFRNHAERQKGLGVRSHRQPASAQVLHVVGPRQAAGWRRAMQVVKGSEDGLDQLR